MQGTIDDMEVPWSVQQLGARAEYWFSPPPRTGGEAARLADEELAGFFHLYALNRGVLLTPFHNMALFSVFHKIDDVNKHTGVFRDCIAAIAS